MAQNNYSEQQSLFWDNEFKIQHDPPISSDRQFSPLRFELSGSC
jgi:hypothetical protein